MDLCSLPEPWTRYSDHHQLPPSPATLLSSISMYTLVAGLQFSHFGNVEKARATKVLVMKTNQGQKRPVSIS